MRFIERSRVCILQLLLSIRQCSGSSRPSLPQESTIPGESNFPPSASDTWWQIPPSRQIGLHSQRRWWKRSIPSLSAGHTPRSGRDRKWAAPAVGEETGESYWQQSTPVPSAPLGDIVF